MFLGYEDKGFDYAKNRIPFLGDETPEASSKTNLAAQSSIGEESKQLSAKKR